MIGNTFKRLSLVFFFFFVWKNFNEISVTHILVDK